MRFAALLLVMFAAPTAVDAVTIETVPVGNPGNAADVHPNHSIGAVGYEYEIGKYEVTNAQYVEFLNRVDAEGADSLGLYNSLMTSDARGGIQRDLEAPSGSIYSLKAGRAANPVVFVSFFDSLRFANWMHNGQGIGGTESGSYSLAGGLPIPGNGEFITRNPAATWCLPSFDEWYKAAYHKNNGVTGNYWDYPTKTDAPPYSAPPPGTAAPTPANTANFFNNDNVVNGYDNGYAVSGGTVINPATNYLTNVGAYAAAPGPYGTFDQAGNAWEWNDTSVFQVRRVSGGSWLNDATFMVASALNMTAAANEAYSVGFRLARVTATVNATGDYNGNGDVDAADYTLWLDTLGSTDDLRANGDNSGPSAGLIDMADYEYWKARFGEMPGTAAHSLESVPEPSAALLALAAIGILSAKRIARARRS